ncbi:MAG: M56 family metallopeptidase [Pseudohongiella sp.]|nr:M56 family metallopeptidase [Pseudohongiella sp.]
MAALLSQSFWQGDTQVIYQAVLFELPVYASSQGASIRYASTVLLLVYLVPVVCLFSRLMFALRSLHQLRVSSVLVTDTVCLQQLQTLTSKLGISRSVTLSISTHIESPVSFGMLRPQILLPVQARDWSESVVTDVLLHELCHIRRLDWLTTVSAYTLACVFWIIPLVWLALQRLRVESENSCDTAVLHSGRLDTDYAESLLRVANSCIQARALQLSASNTRNSCNNRNSRTNNPLMQTMLDQNTLKIRIINVLEENKMKASALKRELKNTAAILFVVSAGTLGALGSHQVLHAQQQPDPASRVIDAEMLPLNTIQPRYPTVAAADGIEGWVQVRFTVSADGSVEESSVSIVESQPAEVFDSSAIAAAKQFLFSPRIVAGQPVDVPNVQYVFRFFLSEESERAAQL